MEASAREGTHTTTASITNRLITNLSGHIGTRGLGRSRSSSRGSNNGDGRASHLGHKLSLWERYNWCHRPRLLCSLLTRGNCLSSAGGDETALHHPLNQPMSFSKTGSTSVKALRAEIIISMFAYTAVVVFVCNRTAAIITVDAEHATWRSVSNRRKVTLVLLHIETSILRLV